MGDYDTDAAILALRDYRIMGGRLSVYDSRGGRPNKPGPVTITFHVEDNELYQWCWRRAAFTLQTGSRRSPGYE